MLFRPAPGAGRRSGRPAQVAGAGLAGVAVLLAGGVLLITRGGDTPAPAAAATPARAAASAAPAAPAAPGAPAARGWNLHDGGQITDQQVVAPAAVPDESLSASAGQPGRPSQVPRQAGPGDYTGFQPSVLVLPSGSRAAVLPADVRTDGTLAVPDDPTRVGWWTGGAQPGERYGGVVLAGHVDSQRYGPGVLAEMRTVRPGAVIAVAGTRGQRQSYRVSSVRQIDKARLAADTGAFDQEVSGRLVLITCGGPFDRARHHYRDNIVVIAEPIT